MKKKKKIIIINNNNNKKKTSWDLSSSTGEIAFWYTDRFPGLGNPQTYSLSN